MMVVNTPKINTAKPPITNQVKQSIFGSSIIPCKNANNAMIPPPLAKNSELLTWLSILTLVSELFILVFFVKVVLFSMNQQVELNSPLFYTCGFFSTRFTYKPENFISLCLRKHFKKETHQQIAELSEHSIDGAKHQQRDVVKQLYGRRSSRR